MIMMATQLPDSDSFAGEEVASTCGYASGYVPKSIPDQIAELRKHFNGLNFRMPGERNLPAGAEGIFIIPRWWAIASTHNEAIRIMLAELSQATNGRFTDYTRGLIVTPGHLREEALKANNFLGEAKKCGDYLAFPAQFGLMHRGRSVRRACEVMSRTGQFGLGVYETAVMLLTHSNRLVSFEDLYIDCAGDEVEPSTVNEFCFAPYFRIDSNGIGLGFRGAATPDARYGSLSGFRC